MQASQYKWLAELFYLMKVIEIVFQPICERHLRHLSHTSCIDSVREHRLRLVSFRYLSASYLIIKELGTLREIP